MNTTVKFAKTASWGNREVTPAYLKKKAGVELVTPEGYEPFREDNVSHAEVLDTIEAPRAWEKGYDGSGVGIVLIDSGAEPHPSIANRIRFFKDFSDDNNTQLSASHYHGTSMASAAAAAGAFPGVAPGAHLLILKLCQPDGQFYGEQVTKAVEWVAENKERYNIGVLNMSFGLDDKDKSKVMPGLEAALASVVKKGVIPLAAAGNEGPGIAKLGPIAASPNTLAVGASDGNGTADGDDDTVLKWSTRVAPDDPNRPEVLAPGIGLVRAHGRKTQMISADGGTSPATALASGAVAVWKQANPELTLEGVRAIVAETSQPLEGYGPEAQGHGVIRVQKGLEAVL